MASNKVCLLSGSAVAALVGAALYFSPAQTPVPLPAEAPRPTLEQVQALIERSSNGNAVAEKLLPKRSQGLTGAIVNANGQKLVAWITPDAKGLLVGALFNDQGENLTMRAMEANHVMPQAAVVGAADKPRPARGDLIDAVEKADGFVDGEGALMVHAFIDLNCGYCSGLYRQLRPLIDAAQIRIHWIPVAILHKSSLMLAAELLQSNDPAAKLADHETRRNPSTGEGGLAGQPPSKKTQQIIEANSGLLKVVNEGVAATPMILFRGRNGQVFQHAGLLREASDVLAAGS